MRRWGAALTVVVGLVAGVGARGEAPALIERQVVSQEEMDRWPVDRARSGEKCWAETTWGTGPLEGPHRNLFDWNTWPCRVVFEVDDATAASPVVHGEAEWRRSSLSIRMKGLKLVAATTGEEIADARVVEYGQPKVAVDFRPAAGPGLYYLYYGAAEEACFRPSEAWQAEAQGNGARPNAVARRIEARCKADAFDDMEIVARPDEADALLAKHAEAPYLVFPEDRDRSIKLQFEVPVSWAVDGPRTELALAADRHEYRVFQLGVWACRKGLADVSVAFSDLHAEAGGGVIGADRLQCLTLESRIKSRYIEKPSGPFPVPAGEVRALWCGIDLPEDAAAGVYTGTATVKPAGDPALPEAVVPLRLTLSDTVVPERGDHDLYRMSRLRWVESDVGLSDEVFPPYEPLKVAADGKSVSTWGHTLTLGDWGLPARIEVGGAQVTARPLVLEGRVDGAPVRWDSGACTITGSAPGYTEWEGQTASGGVRAKATGRIEYDGCVVMTVALESADGAAHRVDDLSLGVAWKPRYAPLAAGMGYRGLRQGERSWRQTAERSAAGPAPMLWMGSVDAGLGFGTWDTTVWEDATRADAAVVTEDTDAVVLRLNLGAHDVSHETPWQMTFALLPTPVKPADKRHWQFRYMHKGGGFWPAEDDTPQSFLADNAKRLDAAKALGVRRLNLHDWWGPMFNYAAQWDGPDNLSRLTGEAHNRGLFVKVYNSGRELSSFAPEFWFLAYEGTGRHYAPSVLPEPRLRFQDAWEQNHLPDVFTTGWPRCHRDLGNEHCLPVSNSTRNGNFYLESMRYMTRFYGTDGAYWDGADGPTLGHREMAKRLWVMFRQTNPNAAIDVHHGHPMLDSPISMYMFCFPFVDSLWHGEGFDYDRFDPWTWLVEVSATPFNMPSEMLGGFDYPGRGMLYGIWPRYGWGGQPEYIAKLWQFFDRFGMDDAEMLGWWLEPLGLGRNGVTVDRPETYVTAFKHPTNGVLLAIATWHPPIAAWMEQTFDVSLLLDRGVLGLPQGALKATDIFTGAEVDISKPVSLPDMKAGRLIWVRDAASE